MSTSVLPGQIWSVSEPRGERKRFRILDVSGEIARIEYDRSGRRSTIRVSTLALGRRGAALESGPRAPQLAERPTRLRDVRVLELHECGVDRSAIAERLGLTQSRVSNIISKMKRGRATSDARAGGLHR